ncbi:MAG: DNA polymerase III subunit delta [Blastocatellia bacterium]|nr:DNA polymerase III subunit delta [Blastocatellia bacterium]
MSNESQKQIKFTDFQKEIRSGKIRPLYFLYGKEAYLHKEALRLLKAVILEQGTEMFNYNEISASSQSMSDILAAADQYPMFGGRRLVVARDFEKLTDAELDSLKEYLKNPQATTTLVFQAEEIDKRRNVSTALLKTCTVVDLSPFRDKDAVDWVVEYLREAGYQISTRDAALLIGFTGTDLFLVRNELEKLITSVTDPERPKKKGLISTLDIQSITSRSRHYSGYDLADAVVAGEHKKSIRLLIELLDDNTEPLMLLGVISRTLRQILMAKELMQQQIPSSDIAKDIGIPPFKSSDFLAGARKWDKEKILKTLKRASEVDDAIKNSLGKPRLQLEYLLCELFL